MGSCTPDLIDATLNGRKMSYYDLAVAIFKDDASWRRPTRGGPPGCYMALSSALRRGGFYIFYSGRGAASRIVHPRKQP
jgi:hypothetical protein